MLSEGSGGPGRVSMRRQGIISYSRTDGVIELGVDGGGWDG